MTLQQVLESGIYLYSEGLIRSARRGSSPALGPSLRRARGLLRAPGTRRPRWARGLQSPHVGLRPPAPPRPGAHFHFKPPPAPRPSAAGGATRAPGSPEEAEAAGPPSCAGKGRGMRLDPAP